MNATTFQHAPVECVQAAIESGTTADMLAGLMAIFHTLELFIDPHTLPPDSAMALAQLSTDGRHWVIVERPEHRFAIVRGPLNVAQRPILFAYDLSAKAVTHTGLPVLVIRELADLSAAFRLRHAKPEGHA